ncbi:amidase family protein [Caballeronia sp. GaOx3]|uniref:amidase family protein n=1 Tax=Caballeronia sp. GaOx3 TaxID=2921740 RepID=UPI002027E0D8|nr:amidase family protein [Caballeronia sp. GaOx3]
MGELWRLSATELADLIRCRKVSAREAAQAALARLDSVNPKINAVVDYRPDDVLSQAEAVDAAIARGDELGLLAGVPVTIKIGADQAGFATTDGMRLQRDHLAALDNPAVANLRKAGSILLGRTNCPTVSYRWFSSNLIHGDTTNPRDASLTPGGSSSGAGAAVAAGIGHIAHGSDIAGSIRYPAYACGVHGLRPSLGRVPHFNPSFGGRSIGGQIAAVSGPLARTVNDLRISLAAMSAPSALDPWYAPVPLNGPLRPKRVAMCLNPDGLDPVPEVITAVADAGRRLRDAGWVVEEINDTPPMREPADLLTQLWLGDGYEAQLAMAEREGDPGALACLRGVRDKVLPFDLSAALARRDMLTREWFAFLDEYPVLLMPVSGELPFLDNLDLKDDASFERVWNAQLPQLAIPLMGLPALTVSTGPAEGIPVGVQFVAARFREDLCLAAGEAIEAGERPIAMG